MPLSASMPASPLLDGGATRASHGSPASTRRRGTPSVARSMPRFATRSTVPSKRSSATTRFEPPPRTSQSSGSPQPRARRRPARRAVVASTRAPAGPPTRSVVSSREVGHAGSGDAHLRLAEHGLVVEGDGQVDARAVVVERADLGDDRDVGAVGGVDRHRRVNAPGSRGPGRCRRQPVDDRLDGEAHGEHAVGEHAGQPDGLRDVVAVVDGVEVADAPPRSAPASRG